MWPCPRSIELGCGPWDFRFQSRCHMYTPPHLSQRGSFSESPDINLAQDHFPGAMLERRGRQEAIVHVGLKSWISCWISDLLVKLNLGHGVEFDIGKILGNACRVKTHYITGVNSDDARAQYRYKTRHGISSCFMTVYSDINFKLDGICFEFYKSLQDII